mgnify:CR=1 FL=1
MSAIAVGVGVAAAAAGAAVSASMKPKAPKPGQFTPVDQQAEQRKAIMGNQASFDDISALATRTNNFNSAELQRMYELALPGYSKLRGLASSGIEAQLSGKLSPGTIATLQSSNAWKNVGKGLGGTGMQWSDEARTLGLTSEGQFSKGLSSMDRWLESAKAPMFDFSSMFVNPNPQFAASERDKKLGYGNASARYSFENDPWNQFQSSMADQIGNFLGKGVTYGAGALTSPKANYTGSSLPGASQAGWSVTNGFWG